jgi:pimeloyl-ACP methyl ester carboxylesterase
MKRWLKVLLAVLAALVVLLILNAVALDRQTKEAEVTVDGGALLRLPAGDLQVLDEGPREGPPIVLLHCYTCAIDWWDEVIPALARDHRVIAIDLLGHGGSEKPRSGYSMPEQAELVAQVLAALEVRGATVVGHSLGGAVAIALAEQVPDLVGGIAIIDTEPDTSYGSLGLLARATHAPVLGEALWRVKVDATIREGLKEAFAPDFDVPDQFVDDVKRMTYSAFDGTHSAFDDYVSESPLDQRMQGLGIPLLVVFGAEEQIVDDPREALSAYAGVPGAQTELISGAGHSPNVERPDETARLILRFSRSRDRAPSPAGSPSSASETAGPPITVGCEGAIIAAGPPDWRRGAFGATGSFGLGFKRAVPGGLANYEGAKVGDVFSVQLQALVEGHSKVVLRVPRSERSRVGLVYGQASGATRLPQAARQATFQPCADKPRTVWPGGLALADRRPITLEVVFGQSVRKLRLD